MDESIIIDLSNDDADELNTILISSDESETSSQHNGSDDEDTDIAEGDDSDEQGSERSTSLSLVRTIRSPSKSAEPIDIDTDIPEAEVYDGNDEQSNADDEDDDVDITDTIFISDNESDSSSEAGAEDNCSDGVIFERVVSVQPEIRQPIPKRRVRNKAPRAPKTSAVKTVDIVVEKLSVNNLCLQAKVNVELKPRAISSDPRAKHLKCGYFMRIKKIIQRTEVLKGGTEMRQEWIQGHLFRRHRDLDGILPKTAGEVALVREKAEVRAGDVHSIRELIMTNQLGRDTFRKSYQDAKDDVSGRLICRWKAKIKDNINGNTGMQQLGATGYIRRLTEMEADPAFRVSDMELSKSWRMIPEEELEVVNVGRVQEDGMNAVIELNDDETLTPKDDDTTKRTVDLISPPGTPFGTPEIKESTAPILDSSSHHSIFGPTPTPEIGHKEIVVDEEMKDEKKDDIIIIDADADGEFNNIIDLTKTKPLEDGLEILEERSLRPPPPRIRRKYTFGDAFCGAGGATCGAVKAGFKVRWGVDHDITAITAWRSNFGRRLGYHEDVHDFVCKRRRKETHVDLLHLSPPCQFFSWARTIPGRNDERNEASFFVVPNTLSSCRPRVVTVEETDGLIGLSRSVGHFKCMLGDFTSMGYSVKYGILNAASYGVPSKRKRLVMIACCPGETLADFPAPTHFYQPDPSVPRPANLRRAITLREAIGRIPPNAPDHKIEYLENVAPSSLRQPPHEWDQPFRSTIKCGGGEYNLHPSRRRKFTLRELACLQSFPIDHQFHGKKGEKMRQIGNAFPPLLVGAVMDSIRRHLEKIDNEWEGGGIL